MYSDWTQLPFYPVRQIIHQPRVEDISETVKSQLLCSDRLKKLPPGSSIAVAVGSRGIANLQFIVQTTITTLKSLNLAPFVVAAMGSHGGATAEGQRDLLASYGSTPEALGVPVKSDMEVEQIGTNVSGIPVYWDKNALAADAVITISRIKPHTDFVGTYESGIVKMIVIGLGKRESASAHHRYGVKGLRDFIPQSAKVVLEKTKFLLGLGIIENASDETAKIIAVDRDDLLATEPGLLIQARAWMPKIPFKELDLLVVGECGKNYSGTGMDTNVLGRQMLEGVTDTLEPNITRICLLALSEETHGNATGLGLADLVSHKVIQQMDPVISHTNSLTSCCLMRSRVPIDKPTDWHCIETGLATCWQPDLAQLRMAIIPNTLEMNHLWVSPYLHQSLPNNVVTDGEPMPLPFLNDRTLNQKMLFPHSVQGKRK